MCAEAFGDETPFLLDGGPCEVGLESTVVAVTKDGLEVLRPGMAFVEDASVSSASEAGEAAHRSPGQHKKHYSPRTRVLLVSRGKLPEQGRGAYLWLEARIGCGKAIRMPGQPEAYAAQLYRRLHELDREGLDWIAVGNAAGDAGVGGHSRPIDASGVLRVGAAPVLQTGRLQAHENRLQCGYPQQL